MSQIVVAVDGPAGSGKSSVSKRAASQLGYAFLDTGAAYRALAWLALERDINLDDERAVQELLPSFAYAVSLDPEFELVQIGEADVTAAIREPRVSAAVSSVARIPEVREYVNEMFRWLMEQAPEEGVIAEGRDITTVVAPDAAVRVLLTASPEVRSARRSAELAGSDAAEVARHLSERDAKDLKVVDFMSASDGVTTLDSTELSFDDTVDALVSLIRSTVSSG